jgi:hypothetical protein
MSSNSTKKRNVVLLSQLQIVVLSSLVSVVCEAGYASNVVDYQFQLRLSLSKRNAFQTKRSILLKWQHALDLQKTLMDFETPSTLTEEDFVQIH